MACAHSKHIGHPQVLGLFRVRELKLEIKFLHHDIDFSVAISMPPNVLEEVY